MFLLAWVLMPAYGQGLLVDTPRYRLQAADVTMPAVGPAPEDDRVCTLLLAAEPTGVSRYPVACAAALRDEAEAVFDAWGWSLSAPPSSAEEVGRLSLVFPTEGDPRTGAFLGITLPDALQVTLPPTLVCLGPTCGLSRVLPAAAPAPAPQPAPLPSAPQRRTCDVEVMVDWFGHTSVVSVTGCPSDVHPLATRAVRDGVRCPRDVVPTTCSRTVSVFLDDPAR